VSAPATIELDAQYRQLREECGLLERSARGKLRLSGADATEFLQGQLTNDIEALAPGAGCYSALLDRKGHMQADMRVLALADGAIWIDTEAEALERVRRHLDTYKIGRAVELEDMTSSRAIISLIGPASESVAGTAAGPEHSQRAVTIGGADCVAVATGGGIDLICDAEAAPAVRSALLAAGAAEVSDEAAEIVRVESGVPRFGIDVGTATMPAEAGLVGRAVSFTKGCYIGQETVARLHYRGRPNRHLRGLRLSGAAERGDPLLLGGKEVGLLGSFCVSPRFGPIGMAVVRREAEPGDRLAVGEDGVEGEVVELPFAPESQLD
jgi:folate-binding protein YgfZ